MVVGIQEAFDLELMATQLVTQLHDWIRNTSQPRACLWLRRHEPAGHHVLTFPGKEDFRPDFLAPRQPSDRMTVLLSGCGKGLFILCR